MEDYLSQHPELVQSITEHTYTGVSILNYSESLKDFVFLKANAAFYTYNTFVQDNVNGRSLLDVFPNSRKNGMFDFMRNVLKERIHDEKILYYHHPERGYIYQSLQAEALDAYTVFVIFNDITETENFKKRAEFEQQRFSETVNSLRSGIITTDSSGHIEIINKYAQQLFGLSEEDARGRKLQNLLTITPWQDQHKLEGLMQSLKINNVVVRDSKKKLRATVRKTDLIDDIGRTHGSVYAFEDMSDFLRAQEELLYINYHDTHTGFYNRTYLKYFMDNLAKHSNYGVVSSDINGLKRINNLYGMDKGDQLINLCANAIRDSVPADTVCVRFGEDDFLAVVPPTSANEPANLLAVIDKTREAYKLRQKAIGIDSSLSFGQAVVKGDVKNIQQAIGAAQEQMLYHKVLERKSMHSAALNSLLAALQVRSHETEEHAQRLYQHAVDIGNEIGITEKEQHFLSLLSSLHDIGKIGVPDFVLNKPGPLTDGEWKIMKGHPDLGSRILEATPELREIAPLVRAHHERWDGKGYPDGLAGDEIPLLARIIAVVDAYDAMTNDRVYREALSSEQALIEIQKGAGSQFDPEIAAIFVEVMTGSSEQANISPLT